MAIRGCIKKAGYGSITDGFCTGIASGWLSLGPGIGGGNAAANTQITSACPFQPMRMSRPNNRGSAYPGAWTESVRTRNDDFRPMAFKGSVAPPFAPRTQRNFLVRR